jgi:uncharacterized protein YuzE
MDAMSVTIDNLTFDHSHYDAEGDVLYLSRGGRQAAADSEGTPEGHVVRFDAEQQIIGITLINARWLLEQQGKIEITLPHQVEVSAASIDSELVAA